MERMRPPIVPEEPPPILREPEIKAILDACAGADFEARRDTAIIRLLLDTGMRRGELAGLALEDVDLGQQVALVMGKGRKERRVPFAKVTRLALEALLTARRRIVVPSDLLFISRHGGELTSRHVQIMIKRYGERAGIKGVRVSPHTLRHTCATQYIRNGGDVFSLQKILGHSTLEMVRNYVNLASRDVYDAHRRFSPMDRLLSPPLVAAA